ncbi:unnamed protein product [Rhizophagus irregularis]|uniref:Uncharacterized protein n=1 Tax=Rhizophagus irregularis TaxID=588596 RepID=A0A915YVA2_9GLOM|nr:unnamed protein product [Rhizophagus irregularis]
MYKLEINTCEARLKQAKEAELELERIREEEFQRICERTNIDGEVTRLRHIYPQAELRMQQHANPQKNVIISAHLNIVIPSKQRRCNSRSRSLTLRMGKLIAIDPPTSDDMKELEKRPLKRDVNTIVNFSSQHITSKRSHLDSPLALDSEQAEPSFSINTN